ncbi:MAG TPA: hypothetical protein PKC98_22055 [Candidatus Melainabacteria bacterium]|nr:hypothetical protein [Candidatus Melainabacteria bacterium]
MIEQQIQELKDRIVELNTKQEALAHDRESLSEMFSRYASD